MELLCQYTNRIPGPLNDSNPVFLIKNIPPEAVCLVMIAKNPDTEKFHWVVYNIPVTDVIERNFQKGINAVNDFGRHGFFPPQSNDVDSRLLFTLFALDDVLNIGGGKGGNDILKAVNGHICAHAIAECRFESDSLNFGSIIENVEIPAGLHD